MDLKEFREFEKMLGHPPTQKEVHIYQTQVNRVFWFSSQGICYNVYLG
jgi:hypothetical protein